MTGGPQTAHAEGPHVGIPSFMHIKLRGEKGEAKRFRDTTGYAPAHMPGACA